MKEIKVFVLSLNKLRDNGIDPTVIKKLKKLGIHPFNEMSYPDRYLEVFNGYYYISKNEINQDGVSVYTYKDEQTFINAVTAYYNDLKSSSVDITNFIPEVKDLILINKVGTSSLLYLGKCKLITNDYIKLYNQIEIPIDQTTGILGYNKLKVGIPFGQKGDYESILGKTFVNLKYKTKYKVIDIVIDCNNIDQYHDPNRECRPYNVIYKNVDVPNMKEVFSRRIEEFLTKFRLSE